MAHYPLKLRAQRGAAIVVALFVMSLVAIAAVAMLSHLHVDIRRTQLLINADQAYLYAEGSLAWAKDVLEKNLQAQKPNQLVDKLPLASKEDNQAGFQIQSTIYDAQSYFNLNNLAAMEYMNDFVQLIRAVAPRIDISTARKITLATREWITQSQKKEEDNPYAKLNPPYSVPHRAMAYMSELRLVQGMTAELYAKLKPYIIALPGTTPVNVNTAEGPVLMSLSPTLTGEGVKAILQYRQQQAFVDTAKFLDFDVIRNNPIPTNKITVVSNYFLVKTRVAVGEQQTILYTLLKRSTDKNASITILWQTKGTL